MKTKNLLFIVEGKNDEPNLIRHMLAISAPAIDYQIYSYEANLHMLASRLENDYPDFAEDEIDIRLFLKSYENDESRRKLFDLRYTDVFMIFDFEPQHPDPHYDTIRKMMIYFSSSEDNGKLFINYPMMQSYRHLKQLPDMEYLSRIIYKKDFNHYKQIVSRESCINDIRKCNYPDLISIIYHNLLKAFYLLDGNIKYVSQYDYDRLDSVSIYDIEYDYFTKGTISILNTCIFIMIDYNPTAFFNQIEKHSGVLRIPKR